MNSTGTAISLETSIIAISEHVSCGLADEVFILSLKDGVYYGLNSVAARVWQLVQEPRTLREIRDVLVEEFDVKEEDCTRDVLNLLEQLRQWNLVERRNGKGPSPG